MPQVPGHAIALAARLAAEGQHEDAALITALIARAHPGPAYGVWTEHEMLAPKTKGAHPTERPPQSVEVSALDANLVLLATGERPSHFMLRYVGETAEACQAVAERLHTMEWKDWLESVEASRDDDS